MADRGCACCVKDPSLGEKCLSTRCKHSSSFDEELARNIALEKRIRMCTGKCNRIGWSPQDCCVRYPERCSSRY
jgi:hypothetical protein